MADKTGAVSGRVHCSALQSVRPTVSSAWLRLTYLLTFLHASSIRASAEAHLLFCSFSLWVLGEQHVSTESESDLYAQSAAPLAVSWRK